MQTLSESVPNIPQPTPLTGQGLREKRQALYYSQAALADLLGVHPMTVSRWELGKLPRIPKYVGALLARLEPRPVRRG